MSQLFQKPLRGAVVGFGFISAKGHIPAYLERPDVQIIAIADVSEARRTLAQKLLPYARVYSDYVDLLDKEASNLDFLDIATPPCEHSAIALAALERGLHVLCEKPLTPTLEEAERLLRHAKKMKKVLFPCHNYKHAPVVKAISKIIESGKIGKVHSLTLNTYRNTHAKGVLEWNTHWRREKKWSGGGIAMDHGSHTFYLAFDWLGEYPIAVTAKMSTQDLNCYDTEDQFTTVLTFPTGRASAHLSWTAGVRKVIYAIQGEKGAITVDDDHLELAIMRPTRGPDIAQGAVSWDIEKKTIASDWMDASHVSWFHSLFDEFRQAIKNKDWVGKDAKEAYLCIQLITAAYRSSQSKCKELPLDTDFSFLMP